MHDGSDHLAAAANREIYNAGWTQHYVEGAPHVKHASLRAVFAGMLNRAFARTAAAHAEPPRILDICAGEGSVTRELLERGARVTAMDVSSNQLATLCMRCAKFSDRLEVQCGEIVELLAAERGQYDIAIASACLHHIPNYLAVISAAIARLGPAGQFLSFEDQLRYDTVSAFTKAASNLSHLSWQIWQGDVWGGVKRRHRHAHGQFDDSVLDNAKYHVVRGGVDQEAIAALLRAAGFECEIVRYFSTQGRLGQSIGGALGVKNMFGVESWRHSCGSGL